ncbi:MAG: MerR family transcriptional regulator [Proteobacteria bacterium]|nr:MerR family transcriptional regulator [Pseudomonadota bacterium]
MEALRRYENRRDLRLDELVEAANRFIGLVAPVQPSQRVALRINERTLRYYISRGLVDKPLGRRATAALYGYRHLLQVLALKRLQAAYLPVKRISEVLPGLDDQALLEAITGDGTDFGSPLTREYVGWAPEAVRETEIHEAAPPAFAWDGSDDDTLVFMADQTWHRFTVSEGMEISIRADKARELGPRRLRELLRDLAASLADSRDRKPDC